MTPRRRKVVRILLSLFGLAAAVLGTFVLNGLVLAAGERPVPVQGKGSAAPAPKAGDTIRILAYNIAKAFVHQGGIDFTSEDVAKARLVRLAATVSAAAPDLVFLSEALWDCGPCPIDQVAAIADAAGLPHRMLGENYNVGWPGYRIAGGNAILSRFPLRPVANFDLTGRKPFYETTNNRRALFAALDLADGREILLGAMHVDSFSRANNAVQWRQIIDWIGERPTILAGDFNARPDAPGVLALKASGRYAGAFDGPGTALFRKPPERIDFVLAPASFEHLSTEVLASDASDHLPVLGVFRVR